MAKSTPVTHQKSTARTACQAYSEMRATKQANNGMGTSTWVTQPDWHSHSWLTTAELIEVIGEDIGPEYKAVIAAMQSLESSGHEARLVFWFDN